MPIGLEPPEMPPTVATRLVSAGLAGCAADILSFPLDTAKVRLQIQGEGVKKAKGSMVSFKKNSALKYRGIIGTIHTMAVQEGPRSLYNGLVPGLQRQLCFCSIRIGLYDSVKLFYQNAIYKGKAGSAPEGGGFIIKICAGLTTGSLAVSLAQPTDVVKVRFQAQANALGIDRPYSSATNAYKTIFKDEGMSGLWKGTVPNIARNSIVNAAEMVTYDSVKATILRRMWMTDHLPCHVVSGFVAGFVTAVVASPVDVIKTRYMNSPPGLYNGVINCTKKMLFNEGPLAFYKGFMPFFVRIGIWNTLMFVFYEQIKRIITNVNKSKSLPMSSTHY